MSKQDASLKAWIKFEAEDNRPSREMLMHPSFWFISGYEIAEQSLEARVQELEAEKESYRAIIAKFLDHYDYTDDDIIEEARAALKEGEEK